MRPTFSQGQNRRNTFDTNSKNYQANSKFANQENKGQGREQYYKFYLDSAQRAIEMMRKQHKSASLMRLNQDQ